MSDRVLAYVVFGLLTAGMLKALSLVVGFENAVILALAVIAILALDSGR